MTDRIGTAKGKFGYWEQSSAVFYTCAHKPECTANRLCRSVPISPSMSISVHETRIGDVMAIRFTCLLLLMPAQVSAITRALHPRCEVRWEFRQLFLCDITYSQRYERWHRCAQRRKSVNFLLRFTNTEMMTETRHTPYVKQLTHGQLENV